MPTITGTLQTILDEAVDQGIVEVALCGYGSRVPRINAQGLGARVTDDVDVGTDGTFTFDVAGNDQIAPQGTYYTVTVKDDNGDIVQVNAYQFLSTTPDYDLNLIDPYDPNTPPPPLPPIINNLLLIVAYSPTAQFPGDVFTSWQITLAGDCAPTFVSLVDGNLYTLIVKQDGTGGHQLTWPANVSNATMIDTDPNSTTIQAFVAVSGDLYPIGAGTFWP
jgi:hypothetical protein